MLVKICNLKMPLDADTTEVFSAAKKSLPVPENEICTMKILRRAIDARHGTVQFVYTLSAQTKHDFSCDGKTVVPMAEKEKTEIKTGSIKLDNRPVIVGFGPCGMFCALELARRGFRPLVIERGADVDTRTEKVNRLWQTGALDPDTNVQFGEGGAGTFSDGKLTTGIGDDLLDDILKTFVDHGAPEDIMYSAMPHIGTDILKGVVRSIRQEIIRLGGEVRFCTALSDISVQSGKLRSVTLTDGNEIPCGVLILAIGHSARDTYEMLFSRGIEMIQKPFSVGFRIEHLREEIDTSLYGKYAGHPLLGAATYKLSYREGERGCYSFCMCPGGTVVNASSEANRLVTNGMSERARNERNSNSAICVSVMGDNFGDNHPLSGVLFQRTLERQAYILGGKNFCAPVQRLGDYIDGTKTERFGKVKPTFLPGTNFADLNALFPNALNQLMKKGLNRFERNIKGFTDRDALLTGVETRTSAPLRIVRNEELQSVSAQGLYPAGEGAGYAGGIMSAARDGIRVAHQIIKTYRPD